MKIPDEVVLEAYERLNSQNKTAAETGISQSQVGLVLRRNGVQIGRGQNLQYRKYDPERVLEDYRHYKNQREVARIHGMSQGQVSRLLRAHYQIGKGAEMTNLKQLPEELIVARYQAGESCQKIAPDYGVTWGCIHHLLIRLGIPRRTPKENARKGSQNSNWKGGGSYPAGYKARAVVEQHVGRPLLPGTVVHHHDENPFRNDPDNLWVFPNGSCHALYHHKLLHAQQKVSTVDANLAALESGGVPLLPVPGQNSSEHATSLLALFGKG
jgi:transposase-like protein